MPILKSSCFLSRVEVRSSAFIQLAEAVLKLQPSRASTFATLHRRNRSRLVFPAAIVLPSSSPPSSTPSLAARIAACAQGTSCSCPAAQRDVSPAFGFCRLGPAGRKQRGGEWMNRLAKITHCCLILRRACLCRMLVGKQGESEDQDAEPRYPSTSVSSPHRNRTFRPGLREQM